MNNKQAIEYIERLMTNYNSPLLYDKENKDYRLCRMWLSAKDMIALKMGLEALKNICPNCGAKMEQQGENDKEKKNQNEITKDQVIEAIKNSKIDFSVSASIDLTKYVDVIQEILDNVLAAQIKAIEDLYGGE